jgi:hypothetical protein
LTINKLPILFFDEGFGHAFRQGGVAVRLAVAIPGILWLLMPPICICHLPEKLAGTYFAPEYPQHHPENEDHIPGCPAAKKMTPHNFAEWERPNVESDSPVSLAVAVDTFEVSLTLSAVHRERLHEPPPLAGPVYLALCTLLI